MRAIPALLLLIAACHRGEVCPAEAGAAQPVHGDANADGRVDIADGAWIVNHALYGGPPPACAAAADMTGDGVVEPGDAYALWASLYTGGEVYGDLEACEGWAPPAGEPTCGRLGLTLVESAAGVEVRLYTPDLALEAWSISLFTDGCRVTTATTAGTWAGLLTEGGQRRAGWDSTSTNGEVASSAVQMPLGPAAEPFSVLSLALSAGACERCRVSLLDAAISVDGRSYVPPHEAITLEVCP